VRRGDTGWMPAHLSLWRGDTLVAVAPSYVKGHSEGEFVFDWSWADLAQRMGVRYYPKVLVAVPFTPATGDACWWRRGSTARSRRVSWRARRGSGAAASRAAGCTCSSPASRRGRRVGVGAGGYLRREGFQYHWFRHGATTFDEYLARFTSKQRNQIKRELRGVTESGVTVETLAPEGHTRELARTMHGFYASTVENHGRWGRLYLSESFFEAVVERFRDRLAWVVARDARRGAVGGAFNVVKGSRLYGRYWGASVAAAVPALRRLLLRGHPPRDRARPRRLRAGGGRGAQAGARLRPDVDALVPLAGRREDAQRHRAAPGRGASPRAGARGAKAGRTTT
jgi:predicted N-acyltransferase